MKLLMDTSVIIDFSRSRDKSRTLLSQLVKAKHHLAISMITHTELFAGKSIWENQALLAKLERFLSYLELVPLTPAVSRQAGRVRARHELDLFDAIIAATALEQQVPLVTLNSRHFARVEDLEVFEVKTGERRG